MSSKPDAGINHKVNLTKNMHLFAPERADTHTSVSSVVWHSRGLPSRTPGLVGGIADLASGVMLSSRRKLKGLSGLHGIHEILIFLSHAAMLFVVVDVGVGESGAARSGNHAGVTSGQTVRVAQILYRCAVHSIDVWSNVFSVWCLARPLLRPKISQRNFRRHVTFFPTGISYRGRNCTSVFGMLSLRPDMISEQSHLQNSNACIAALS